MIEITAEMKRQFRSEVTEHLNHFEKMLMILDKDPANQEAIHAAFREIHSIKGNSDYLGIKDINTLSHDLEDLMDDLREKRITLDESVLDILFEGLDFLRDMNRRIVNEAYEESNISEIQEQIRHIKSCQGDVPEAKRIRMPETELFSDVLTQEIKVELEKIDTFMSHVAEFTITKNMLSYLTEQIISDQTASQRCNELKQVSENISRISDNLQADVMKLRLIRINTLFDRIPRIIRDISHKNKKKIALTLSGGETEIDRKTIESLIDPLIHLIRNAVDHGIERPEERIQKGKPESGTITVASHQEGNYIIIEITDDGQGLDLRNIQAVALKRNLVAKPELSRMSEQEILNLVFIPGFSTLKSATTVSGRGVGLDIVQNNIRHIGGDIAISSKQDKETRVRLRIPISISLTQMLLIEAQQQRYAFPFSSVSKTVKIGKKHIRSLKQNHIIVWEGEVIPIRYLGEILAISSSEPWKEDLSETEFPVIILRLENRISGIVVDRILKRETLLVKPLEKDLFGIKEFSGAALLGDGSVVLVIDPMGVI